MSKHHKFCFVALALTLALTPLVYGLASLPAAAATGGVNTGLPGSTCSPTDAGLVYTAPGLGVSTTALGTAPAYYELGQPSGGFDGQPPKGLMVVIHGGGWYLVGPAVAASERPFADIWRNRGWMTLNITYRACAQSVPDVTWFHDAARQLVGPTLPICATGRSAGGHLALMMASLRPDVACVISEAGPTDLAGLATGKAFDVATRLLDQTGPTRIYNMAVAAFGVTQLAAMSPALHPANARLLLGTAQQDTAIPVTQARTMAVAVHAAHPDTYADVDELPVGTPLIGFTHTKPPITGVSRAAYDEFLARELKAVASVVAPAGVTYSVVDDFPLANPSSSFGDEEFDVTLSPTQAQVSVSGRVALAAGQNFKIQSCVAYYPPGGAPQATCNTALADTHASSAATGTSLPVASMTLTRPAAGATSGFAYGFGVVWSLDATSHWVQVASSMPAKTIDAGAYISALTP